MAKTAKPQPAAVEDLRPVQLDCRDCGRRMRADYANRRTVTTLAGVTRLNLTIRRCPNPDCPAFRRPYRPEAEGRVALPRHEFGLDVVARIGALRYAEHRAVPEIHRDLVGRGLAGSFGQDWFLFQAGEDRATDLHDEAFVNDLDFING